MSVSNSSSTLIAETPSQNQALGILMYLRLRLCVSTGWDLSRIYFTAEIATQFNLGCFHIWQCAYIVSVYVLICLDCVYVRVCVCVCMCVCV